jgi:hypothetical protein
MEFDVKTRIALDFSPVQCTQYRQNLKDGLNATFVKFKAYSATPGEKLTAETKSLMNAVISVRTPNFLYSCHSHVSYYA